MPVNYYRYRHPFRLESGRTLPELTIAYHTFGTREEDNVVWVCHALTANSDVADWWPHTVETGKFLDPGKYFTVCANILGSHYGTTGPLSVDPRTGKKYYDSFPVYTVRDMVRVHFLLAEHLGITKVRSVVGSSIGGFQAMEMVAMRPDFARSLVLIATSALARPWTIAFSETQRMAIDADVTFGLEDDTAGKKGMAAARAIGLLSYRGSPAYNLTQAEGDTEEKTSGYRAASYQRYQGEKLCNRFDAYSYYRISQAFDTHDIGRGRGGTPAALSTIGCPTLIVGITSDIILPVTEQTYMFRHIPNSRIDIISSEFGHDGFLVEHEKLNSIIKPFLENFDHTKLKNNETTAVR